MPAIPPQPHSPRPPERPRGPATAPRIVLTNPEGNPVAQYQPTPAPDLTALRPSARPAQPSAGRPGPGGHNDPGGPDPEQSVLLERARLHAATHGSHLSRPQASRDLFELSSRAFVELTLGRSLGPREPAARLEMDRAQAAAATLFKQNLAAADPDGSLRGRHEFIQAFARQGETLVATGPLLHGPGRSLAHVTGAETATHIVHCRANSGAGSAGTPDNLDFLMAHKRAAARAAGAGGIESHMLYDHRTDAFYGYTGRLNPATGAPEFHALVNPFDPGPRAPGIESARPLPDPGTYGHHFIHWPAG